MDRINVFKQTGHMQGSIAVRRVLGSKLNELTEVLEEVIDHFEAVVLYCQEDGTLSLAVSEVQLELNELFSILVNDGIENSLVSLDDGLVQVGISFMVFERGVVGEDAFEKLLELPFEVGLSSDYGDRRVHASDQVQRSLALGVPCKFQVELLTGHLGEIVLFVSDFTESQQVEEGIAIEIRQQGVSFELGQGAESGPVQLGASYVNRSDAALVS
uniref:Uncharacterized protein n=1 Tax=Strombidium inclinatum TaxID=197538 RepID=A0A7S3IWT7_9SPIT|mmetsp:Transcript_6184/g.9999  ORF Transcript_6184/g.9999 Transcript_6184/m.9999 type:complete len:215 (+) Transcript_6184:1089-1733(+)